jgi:hypothetical protein
MPCAISITKYDKFLILASLLCTAFLFWDLPYVPLPRLFNLTWDLGHLFLFSVITYLVLKFSTTVSSLGLSKQIMIITFSVFFLSVIIEIAQKGLDNRSPDALDIMRNIAGSLFAIAYFSPSKKKIKRKLLNFFRSLVLFIIIILLLPLAISVADEVYAYTQFPVLGDFETPLEIIRWSGEAEYNRTQNRSAHGKYGLKIVLHPVKYSGVSLEYLHGDWRKYKYLLFYVFSPQDDVLQIVCRIHDKEHERNKSCFEDRFNRNLTLYKGWNLIKISLEDVLHAPVDRKMDMSHISGLGLFSLQLQQNRTVYLDYVRLMK